MSQKLPTHGDVIQINLGNGYYSFGCATFNSVAFYDFRSNEVPEINEIVNKPILFTLWVMDYAYKKNGDFKIMGNIPINDKLNEPPKYFKEDPISKKLYIYWENGDTHQIAATYDECSGLERAAVWDPDHIIDRLNDHYEGKPNKWAESLKLKK